MEAHRRSEENFIPSSGTIIRLRLRTLPTKVAHPFDTPPLEVHRALPAKALELARGIEPPTCGLQNHCSAIELRQPARQDEINYSRRSGNVATAQRPVKQGAGGIRVAEA
jgi:hypothetical protein